MNRTKDELLLECIKQFEHIESVLGHNRLSTTRSLINEINQALTIPAVVGQSEQLLAFKEWERDKCKLPWDAEPKQIVEKYLSQ